MQFYKLRELHKAETITANVAQNQMLIAPHRQQELQMSGTGVLKSSSAQTEHPAFFFRAPQKRMRALLNIETCSLKTSALAQGRKACEPA